MTQKRGEGWISGEKLAIPRQTLSADEVEPFLRALFSDVARRPEPLLLRETAAVVRYLWELAAQGVPAAVAKAGPSAVQQHRQTESREQQRRRRRLRRLGEQIWTMLLQSGDIRPANKTTARRFLREHSQTYLAALDPDSALEIVEELELSAEAQSVYRPPALMSQTLTAQGDRNPRLGDDLSERIYTAHQALKRAGVRGVLRRVAEVLTEEKAAGRKGGTQWTYEDVNRRVRQYERQLKKQFLKQAGNDRDRSVQRWRDGLVDSWILRFRVKQRAEQNAEAGREPPKAGRQGPPSSGGRSQP